MTETKLIGCDTEIKAMHSRFVFQYIQYFNGLPVARFKLREYYVNRL